MAGQVASDPFSAPGRSETVTDVTKPLLEPVSGHNPSAIEPGCPSSLLHPSVCASREFFFRRQRRRKDPLWFFCVVICSCRPACCLQYRHPDSSDGSIPATLSRTDRYATVNFIADGPVGIVNERPGKQPFSANGELVINLSARILECLRLNSVSGNEDFLGKFCLIPRAQRRHQRKDFIRQSIPVHCPFV